jgi:hypothetical protein
LPNLRRERALGVPTGSLPAQRKPLLMGRPDPADRRVVDWPKGWMPQPSRMAFRAEAARPAAYDVRPYRDGADAPHNDRMARAHRANPVMAPIVRRLRVTPRVNALGGR